MYKLVKNMFTGKVRAVNKIGDGFVLSIPFNPANTDYQAYLAWLEEGNEPLPAEVTE
jgi:hypothetical protein